MAVTYIFLSISLSNQSYESFHRRYQKVDIFALLKLQWSWKTNIFPKKSIRHLSQEINSTFVPRNQFNICPRKSLQHLSQEINSTFVPRNQFQHLSQEINSTLSQEINSTFVPRNQFNTVWIYCIVLSVTDVCFVCIKGIESLPQTRIFQPYKTFLNLDNLI